MADPAEIAPLLDPALGVFDRDTAVWREGGSGDESVFGAEVSPDWRAGRGPHGGYLAAMLLRALMDAVADPVRSPRSLTIHYARAPEPGPVTIRVTIERAGRSLSTLSARMERDGSLIALALAAFSVPWSAPEVAELPMPDVGAPDPVRETGRLLHPAAPPFTQHLVMQPRIGAVPFQGSEHPMEIGAWLGLAEPRPIDALSLAFFSDALFSPPFIRMSEAGTSAHHRPHDPLPHADAAYERRRGGPRGALLRALPLGPDARRVLRRGRRDLGSRWHGAGAVASTRHHAAAAEQVGSAHG